MKFNEFKSFLTMSMLIMLLFLSVCNSCASVDKTPESIDMELSAEMKGISIAMNKLVFLPGESIVVMASGITQEMIEAKAFFAIFSATFDTAITYDMREEYQYLLSNSNTLTFTAPNVNGRYEMRLYTKEDYAEDALFAAMVFTVTDDPDTI